jgi:phosphatidylserine/phosphatidylglycerophosphate/cardiolipin synthase-like enzyme
MAILKNSSNQKDIFNGLYEEGSDGKQSAFVSTKADSNVNLKSFVSVSGFLRRTGDNMEIQTKEGVLLKVYSKSVSPDFFDKIVTVKGSQNGDSIIDASISLTGNIKTSKNLIKVKAESGMIDLSLSVKKFLLKYKSVPGLLTARPGYKYIEGQITKRLALVVVVEKKVNPSSLNKIEMLPTTFDNYDVEVVSASPKDYLVHKFSKENTDATVVASSIPLTMLESMASDEAIPDWVSKTAETKLIEAIAINNTSPPNANLNEVTEAMTLICNVSPEGGWKTLAPFLDDTTDHLQVAMYDFSAPHIYESLKTVARRGASIKLVYDGKSAAGVGSGTKDKDVKEDTIINGVKRIAGRNFEYIKAWKGNGGICANAYHIKVAVKDNKEFWLSSGNWQSSNQPDDDFDYNVSLLPKYNREWSMIVANRTLAETYSKFIEWDFKRSEEKPESEILDIELPEIYLPEDQLEIREAARYMLFPPKKFVFTKSQPLRVQPVLSPDNYIEQVLQLIRSAKQKLYFQNQYIKLSAEITPEYNELLAELKDKSNDSSIDCRIILRDQNTNDTRAMLDDLQALGFNMSKVKVMSNTHTKGIIVDSEVVMIGSHNWSNAGVQFNRDASLVIYDEGVAHYYEDVFLHDWERRTKKKHEEEITIIFESSSETSETTLTDNLVKLDWKTYLE